MARFPVGYHALHEDISVNFQLNRFWNWVGEPQMLEELREAGRRIHSYDDLTRGLLALGEQALAEQRPLPRAWWLGRIEDNLRLNAAAYMARQREAGKSHKEGNALSEAAPFERGLPSPRRRREEGGTGGLTT